MTESPRSHNGFADATIRDRGDMVQVIEELVCARSKDGCDNAGREVDERPHFHMLQGLRTLQMLWPAGPLLDRAEDSDEKHSWIRLAPPC
jgi:hypothetical protein